METNLRVILQQLEAEKSIDRETLLEAIRSAIESAARKGILHAGNVTVEVDPDTVTFKVFEIRDVVEKVEDPLLEIALVDALELNPDVVVGNRLKVPTEPKDFGRIAAQTAKQVIIQKIKDAERENVFEEFKQRKGELITGIVKRVSHGNIFVGIGKAEAILPHREQSPRENFKPGDRIRAYVLDVEKGPRGAQVVLSRTSPELVRALFELEVPEIYDGTIQVKAIAREPGNRTKVAVLSNDSNVDAVGACVGMKGSRVRAIDTGADLPDKIEWVKSSGAAWTKDGKGFFYSRYDAPKATDTYKGLNYFHKLYYHRLGTPQAEDALIYHRPDQKEWGFAGGVTDDGRY